MASSFYLNVSIITSTARVRICMATGGGRMIDMQAISECASSRLANGVPSPLSCCILLINASIKRPRFRYYFHWLHSRGSWQLTLDVQPLIGQEWPLATSTSSL